MKYMILALSVGSLWSCKALKKSETTELKAGNDIPQTIQRKPYGTHTPLYCA